MPESKGEANRVLVRDGGRPGRVSVADPHAIAGGAGWLGLVLALAGLADLVLLWVPVQLGSPEWEFATVVSTASALPLVSLGMWMVVGSAAARGTRWLLWMMGPLLATGALVLVLLLVLFLTNVPMALQATSDLARVGIVKASVKTVALAALFGGAYAVVAAWAFRLARGKAREP